MCTMSFIRPSENLLRIAFNRDELRSRPAALPVRHHLIEGHESIFPIDRPSQGTWIAANDAGLVLALLNVNSGQSRNESRAPRSRGEIIPMLLGTSELEEAIHRLADLPLDEFGSFRLMMVDQNRVVQFVSTPDERELDWLATPGVVSSSGLGDELVQSPRRDLFEELLAQSGETSFMQDEFHAHRWAERAHLSVNMSRSDARTVSQTIVELSPDRVRMIYSANRVRHPSAQLRVCEAVRS